MKPRKFEEVHPLLVNFTVGFFIFLGILAVFVFIMRHLSRPIGTTPILIFPAPATIPSSPQPAPVVPSPFVQPLQPGDYFPFTQP